MSFNFNDSLMMAVNDDVNAFDIAKSFVGDNDDKHTLFLRLHKKSEGSSEVEKAENTKSKSIEVWSKY